MTTTEAAAALGVTHTWVWRLIKRGTLAAEKRGRDYWIEAEEVERYRREKAPAHRPKKPTNVAIERGTSTGPSIDTASESQK